jgi:hypothetical protein
MAKKAYTTERDRIVVARLVLDGLARDEPLDNVLRQLRPFAAYAFPFPCDVLTERRSRRPSLCMRESSSTAATNPELVRSLAIGGGAVAVPQQVGGALKDIIDAPDLHGYRQLDSQDILGPVYDAIPGGAPPTDVRDDYLESYAGKRFVESARYGRTYPTELPRLAKKAATD